MAALPPPSWVVIETFGRVFLAEGAQRALAFLRANTEGDLFASQRSSTPPCSASGRTSARLAAAGGEVTPDDEELAAECRARPGRA